MYLKPMSSSRALVELEGSKRVEVVQTVKRAERGQIVQVVKSVQFDEERSIR